MTTSNSVCAQAMALERQLMSGHGVEPESVRRLREHVGTCQSCRADSALIRAVALDDAPDGLNDLSRARLIERVLDQAETVDSPDESGNRKSRALPLALAGTALAAASAVLVLVWHFTGATDKEATGHKTIAHPTARSDAEEMGSQTHSLAPVDHQLSIGERPAVITLPTGIKLLVQPEGQLDFTRTDEAVLEVTLTSGELLASVDPSRKGPIFRVVTRSGTVTVTGTIFAVETTDDDTEVMVLRGAVEVSTRAAAQRVSAGDALLLGSKTLRLMASDTAERLWGRAGQLNKPYPASHLLVDLTHLTLKPSDRQETSTRGAPVLRRTTPVNGNAKEPSVEQLLSQAQAFRQNQEWQSAASAYNRLIQSHPSAAATRVARVALGNMQLEKLHRPDLALDNFDQYLASEDPSLVQEALFGKARALRELGRSQEEQSALGELIRRFPKAMQVSAARTRLREIGNDTPAE